MERAGSLQLLLCVVCTSAVSPISPAVAAVASLAPTALVSASVFGQTAGGKLSRGHRAPGLDLTPPPTPPVLGAAHPGRATLAELDAELARLRLARQAAKGLKAELVDAFIGVRELAATLIQASIADDPGGATAATLGWRLSDDRAAIDAVLRGAMERPDASLDRVRALLKRQAAESAAALDAVRTAAAAHSPDEIALRGAVAAAI